MLFATLILLTAVSVLSLNMFLPSLGFMASDFGVDYSTMTLAVSAYLAFTAVIQLIIGPLADQHGRKPILIGALGLFVLASIGCALAESFETFLFFRILQGAVISGSALSKAIISDLAEPGKAASLLGYMTMAMSVAPIVGPFFGGYLGEIYGWRSNFWLFFIAGIGLWIMVIGFLPETSRRSQKAARFNWADYKALLRDIMFWAYTLIAALGVAGFYIFITGIPLIAVEHLNLSQSETGMAIGSITIGFLIGSFLSGRFSQAAGISLMILSGRVVAFCGISACLVLLLSGFDYALVLFGGTMFVGLGNGISLPSAATAVMYVNRDLSATASGLFGAVMIALGAGFTSVTGIVLSAQPDSVTLASLMFGPVIVGLLIAIWLSTRAKAPVLEN